jgi:hypothetical protein
MARILHVLASPRAEGTPRLVLDRIAAKEQKQAILFLSGDPPDLLAEFRSGCRLIGVEALAEPPAAAPRRLCPAPKIPFPL